VALVGIAIGTRGIQALLVNADGAVAPEHVGRAVAPLDAPEAADAWRIAVACALEGTGAGPPPHRAVVACPGWLGAAGRTALAGGLAAAGVEVERSLFEAAAVALWFASRSDAALAPGARSVVVDVGAGARTVALFEAVDGGLAVRAARSGREASVVEDARAAVDTEALAVMERERLLALLEQDAERALGEAGWAGRDVDAVLASGELATDADVTELCAALFEQSPAPPPPPEAAVLGAALTAAACAGLGEAPAIADATTLATLPPMAAPASGPPAARPSVPVVASRPSAKPPEAVRPRPEVRHGRVDPRSLRPGPMVRGATTSAAPPPTSAPKPAPSVPAGPAPSSEPPAPSLSSPHAWPTVPQPSIPPVASIRPSADPGGVTPAALAAAMKSGRFAAPASASALLGMALSRGLVAADLDPVALPVLLRRILCRRGVVGTLRLSAGGTEALVPLLDGTADLDRAELPALMKMFEAPSGDYELRPERDERIGRSHHTLPRLALDGLRVLLRAYQADELAAAFDDRLGLAPVVRADRRIMLVRVGLPAREQRFVDSQLDGATTGLALVEHGGLGRYGALVALAVLELLDLLEWRPPERHGPSPADELHAAAERIVRAHYFEVLGVHWSATDDEIHASYRRRRAQYAPGGDADRLAPPACARIRERVEEAYATLREPARRIAYRNTTFAGQDFAATADLAVKRSEALSMRGESREARASEAAAKELSRSVRVRDSSAPPSSRRGGS
jgi:hypothetical protein